MSRSQIAWIVAPLLLGLAGCGGSRKKATVTEYPDFLKPLANATDITLYSIDGVDESSDHPVPKTDEKFFGYPVLGKMTVDAETRDAIVRELDRNTRNLDHGFARCFWPRHAFRAVNDKKTIDYVICFHCSWIKVIDGEKITDIVTDPQPQELLNRLLAAKEIPVVP